LDAARTSDRSKIISDIARGNERLSAAVLLCTYKRPQDLDRCITALTAQLRLPDELILAVRDVDDQTRAYLETLKVPFPCRIATVTTPGLVAARKAGVAALQSDIVAMIDDDTVPAPDWLERICQHFEADDRVGAVGGRDRPAGPNAASDARQPVVGILQWSGRYVGNHHSGIGPARPVDLLKGANMSFRSTVVKKISFDDRLRGTGAQSCEDLAFSLAVRGAGWKILYDPEVLVDHYEGDREEIRHYAGMMPIEDGNAFGDITYNWVVAIWDYFSPPRHFVYVVWQMLVGTRSRPGLVQALRFTPQLGFISWQRFWYTQKALVTAYVHLARSPHSR
jgi:GT2 family glycosyltransferase